MEDRLEHYHGHFTSRTPAALSEKLSDPAVRRSPRLFLEIRQEVTLDQAERVLAILNEGPGLG